MVQSQQVESPRRKRGREYKKPRAFDKDCSSSCRSSFGVQDKLKLKNGHQHSGDPTTSRNSNAKVHKSGPKKGNDINAQRSKKPCVKCGSMHRGKCMLGTNNCYRCGNRRHMVRDCP